MENASEILNSVSVEHLVVQNVLDVGSATLEDPRTLRFVGARVGDEWSAAPVEILRWWWQRRAAVRMIRSTDTVSDDLRRLAFASARHLGWFSGFRGRESVKRFFRECFGERC